MLDTATPPGAVITGYVSKLESDTRVYLRDVSVEGVDVLKRSVLVTLMQEKDEDGQPIAEIKPVSVGQKVSGTGRLFAQAEKRNPGGANWRINALGKGYELSGYLLPGWQVQGNARFSIMDMFRRTKLLLSERIAMLFGESAPLFQAVMIGDSADLDGDLAEAMRLTGIAHILSVSGLHMSLMAQALHVIVSGLGLRRKSRFAVQGLLLGCFVCLTGCAIGTIRAYIMAMIRELAALCGRRYDSLTSLAAAALIMTMICPIWALTPAFLFSFFVVLGILLLSGQLYEPIRNMGKCPEWIKRAWQAVAFTASAQAAALPIQLQFYGYIPLLSIPMNLVSGMMIPVIMLGGWAALLLGFACPLLAEVIAQALGEVALLLQTLCVAAAAKPWGILRLPAPYGVTLLLVFALLFVLSDRVYMGKLRSGVAAGLIAVIVLLYVPRFNPAVRYVQLDVGQGDGALLRKGRQAVLIDVGPEGEYAALRYLRNEGLFVDLVILSHLDEDHAGALGLLLDSEVAFNRIAMPVGAFGDVGSQTVLDALSKAYDKGIAFEFYKAGDEIVSGGICFAVLSPEEEVADSNESSLVLYTQMDQIRLLTLADLPDECEMEAVPPCDVLKVAHHGSRYATSRELLEKAMPKAALISVGRNSYGHPTDRVLVDLDEIGADTYRTDQSGCLTVGIREGTCVVTPYIKP